MSTEIYPPTYYYEESDVEAYYLIAGKWSKTLLPLLRANRQNLLQTLQLVDGLMKEQPTQCTTNSYNDVCWAKEVQYGEGNLQSPPPDLPGAFHKLSEKMRKLRESKLMYTCTAVVC